MLTEKEKKHNREDYQKKVKKQLKKTWAILGIILFVFIFGKFLWGLVGIYMPYSGGVRSVKIVKISERGLIWKTWEIEGILAQSGYTTPFRWEFSVDDLDANKENILNNIKTAFSTGQMVEIHYDQRAGSVPWRSKTTYFAKAVRF